MPCLRIKYPISIQLPKELEVRFLPTDGNSYAIPEIKAVGEPPLMYGIGAYFAIHNAVLAFNPSAKIRIQRPSHPKKY